MSLIEDNLENIKASVLVAIRDQLIEAYPSEFGDYKSSRGDNYSKVYWSDTVRYQPNYPYCKLTPQKDISEGYDEISYVKINGVLKKKVNTRSFMTIAIDVCDMGNEDINKSSLKADTFAHKVARQLRKYFNGDEKLDWFSGNEYYPRQISVTVENDLTSILDWSDTDTFFKYSFDIRVGWDDIVYSDADLANGAKITTYQDTKQIDEETIYFKNKGDI